MSFDPSILQIGKLYTRTYLAPLWGYAGFEAIGSGVITPAGGRNIILFVTRQKQKSSTQYQDYISGDILHWEGEKKHRNDIRISTAHENGEDIYLFYRDIHHTPFRYYGRILITSFKQKIPKPSEFTFTLEHDLSPSDDIAQAQFELDSISETERVTLVKARLGQGKFRDELLEIWRGCSVTDIRRPDLLRASHIKPWRNSENIERLNPYNGLLLLPQYDHLFDRGYITFDESGRLEPSPAIVSLPQEKLGIDFKVKLRMVNKAHLPFLEFHRKEVFFQKVST